MNKIIPRLEEDAEGILKYMAWNGLVANPEKTVLMKLGGDHEEKVHLQVWKAKIY